MTMIVVDASPLIMLARSELLAVLIAVAGRIIAPKAVFEECVASLEKPGGKAILTAQAAGLIDVRPAAWTGELLPALGSGELAAIALAKDLGCPLLMDERLGRRIASLHGVSFIGSAAILIKAKERGLVQDVKPILEEWSAHGYFLSKALTDAVLARVGER